MDNTSVNELNALLKGEYMTINGYENYIQDVKNASIKGELENIQEEHKQHAIKIAERIQNLGGVPVQDQGLMGKAAETLANTKEIGKKDTKAILKDAINGESNGVIMAHQVVWGDIDSESNNLVSGMLDADETHLNTLNNLINSTDMIQ